MEVKEHSVPVIPVSIVSNMLEIHAISRILKKKRITNQNEIMAEIVLLKKDMEDQIRNLGMTNWTIILNIKTFVILLLPLLKL